MTQTGIRPTTAPETADTTDQGCACPGGCGSRTRSVTRRAAIGVGVVAGAALVTACGSGDTSTTSSSTLSSSATTPGTSSSALTSSSSADGGATSSAAGSGPADPSSSGAAPSGTRIAALADVPSGGSVIVANGSDQIALARNADGTVVAHSAICTHQGCAVNADGATLKCPCHGSSFDAFTGAVIKPPADAPLAAVTVEVSGDAVYLTS